MKKIINFVIVTAILASFIGCNEKNTVKEEVQNHNCLTDNSVKSITQMPENLKLSFTKEFSSNKSLENVDFENANVIEYSNVEIKGIIADFTNNEDKKFITYYDDIEDIYGVNFIINTIDEDNIKTVTVSNENESPELEIKINNETNKLIEVNLSNNKGYSQWVICVSNALDACMADPSCALMCEFVFPACFSAIAAACAVNPIAPPAH